MQDAKTFCIETALMMS